MPDPKEIKSLSNKQIKDFINKLKNRPIDSTSLQPNSTVYLSTYEAEEQSISALDKRILDLEEKVDKIIFKNKPSLIIKLDDIEVKKALNGIINKKEN